MATSDFETFEGELATTISQIRKLSDQTHISIKSVCLLAWALHRCTYEGLSSIKIGHLGPHLDLTAESIYILDEDKTLIQLCEDFKLLTVDQFDARGFIFKDAILLGSGEHWFEQAHKSQIDTTWKDCRHCVPQVNLIALLSFKSDSARLKLLFDTAVVDRPTVTGYWHTFDKIIKCIVENNDRLLKDSEFLSDHDKKKLIEWSLPLPDEPQKDTICTLFNANVMKEPMAEAIYAWDGTMTYLELDHAASNMAVKLKSFGVSHRDIVPFSMEKSKWALVAALAILKSGAALVPIDPAWPTHRLMAVLNATEAKVVVCSMETRSCFDRLTVQPFVLSTPAVEFMHEPTTSLLPLVPSPTDIAFVLFSSGSTGVPKGMIREHGTACSGSLAHARAMHIDHNSRVLQFANHIFDVAMLDFFTTLIAGGCVCIPSEMDRLNNLSSFIDKSRANWVLLTPTVASILDPTTVPSLKYMTLGGEAINTELLDKWLPYCRVGINYGSAEVDVTHARDVDDSRDPMNVGLKLPSCICYIVHPNNVKNVLPIGAAGELLVSGPTMARSYLKQPERTAISFIPTPVNWFVGDADGAERPWMSRAYRMGDLLQQQWDGSFRFIGRRDFQIKINGQKVELGEIESHLSQHPAVRLCAVLYPSAGPFSKRLVALVEPRDDFQKGRNTLPKLRLEDFKTYLSGRVTPYMIPQILIVTRSMPLTATLKINRTVLLKWLVEEEPIGASAGAFMNISAALEGQELSSEDVTAHELSNLIASLVAPKHSQYWRAIAGHENSLSQIGLDSAQIMQLSRLISKTFGRKISVEVLSGQQVTVKSLSGFIDSLLLTNGSSVPRTVTSAFLHKKLNDSLSRIQADFGTTLDAQRSVQEGPASPNIPEQYNCFLTGATGYLGIHILCALLKHPKVRKVYTLVRCFETTEARSRIVKAAKTIGKSIDALNDCFEIWQGDLAQDRLGLDDTKWDMLTKTNDPQDEIQCFIHCGAVVDWTKSYEELEASNVTSTVQLLNIFLKFRHTSRLIYVSGGQYFQPDALEGLQGKDQLAQSFDDAAVSNGYAQTKAVAEQIVNRVGKNLTGLSSNLLSFHTVKPAYLIGTLQEGIADPNDYLWRIVSAAVRQRSYNADEQEEWLLAADVGLVADKIVELAVSVTPEPAGTSPRTKILHGMPIRDFWRIVSDITGYKLLAVRGRDWLQDIKTTMDMDANHVLWPLLDAVEQNCGLLTARRTPAKYMQEVQGCQFISNVVRKNVEYLVAIGFLPMLAA